MIRIDFSEIQLKLKKEEDKTFVYDPIRKKWIVFTPEEHVRQLLLQHLIHEKKYPASLIAVERKIILAKRDKRFDIVVFDAAHQPWMLAECKAPGEIITQKVLFQLLNYQRTLQSRYWLITNGHQTFCADAGDVENIRWLHHLPSYD